MAKTFTFRAKDENADDWLDILKWCEQTGLPVSSVFNSYLPYMREALYNHLFEDTDTRELVARSDFGDVTIK